MTILKLNDNGIWLLTTILSIIDLIFILNFNCDIFTILIFTPIIMAINLLITSNIKIIDIKKELVNSTKVQD